MPGLAAQAEVRLEGRVVRRSGSDTLAAAGARVVLHRVSRDASGPLDSIHADAAGRFHFRLRPDTAFVYLVSARWSGIEYFGEPLPASSLSPGFRLTLLVSDTASGDAVGTAGRYLVIGAPGTDRDRRVVDLFVLRNTGQRTIVAAARGATWRAPLPAGVARAAVGAMGSDISGDAVRFTADSVFVLAPLPPGDKQLLIEYALPAGQARLELEAVTRDSLQIVVEDSGVTVAGLERAADQVLDGRPYGRWTGSAAGRVVVMFPVASARDRALFPLVGGAVLAMIVAALVARRGRRARPAEVAPAGAAALATRIARLDREHAEGSSSAEEQARYREERAGLKRALAEALRREGSRDGV